MISASSSSPQLAGVLPLYSSYVLPQANASAAAARRQEAHLT
jgi:hypothetical protein